MIKSDPIKYLVLLITLGLFASCTTTKELQMEVMLPAEIIIPSDAKRITIVDNSHPLDSAEGHGIYIKKSGTYVRSRKNYSYDKDPSIVLSHKETVNVDSVSVSVVKNLSNQLVDANFFNAVTLWNSNVRNVNTLKGTPLDKQLLKEIAESTDADIVVTLDALDEKDVLLVREISEGWYDYPTLDVFTQSYWRMYDINENKLLTKIVHKDTIFWEGRLEYNYRVVGMPYLKDAILEAGWNHGREAGQKIVPYWSVTSRSYFTGGASGASQSMSFVKDLDWDNMESYFINHLQDSKKEKAKVIYAYNVAVAKELKGDLAGANDYITKAIEYANELNNSSANQIIKRTTLRYWNILKKRLSQDKLIQLQMSGGQ